MISVYANPISHMTVEPFQGAHLEAVHIQIKSNKTVSFYLSLLFKSNVQLS